MKHAFLFPGQGSQYVGMGQDLCQEFSVAQELFQRADEALGFDLSTMCFEGPEERIRQTENTQPAILVHSMAVLAVLQQGGLSPAVVAGHSLGEYSALVAAEALTFEVALSTVRRRGELMKRAGEEWGGTMAAIIGLPDEKVEEICSRARGVVQPANFNSPEQVVISGEVDAVEEAMQLASEAGAKRAIRLKVSGAFHSPLQKSAQEGLQEWLDGIEIRRARLPVVANVTARPATEPEDLRKLLVEQLTAPVRWAASMARMVELGADSFVEVGPGKVLSRLVGQMDSAIHALTTSTVKEVRRTVEDLRGKRDGARK